MRLKSSTDNVLISDWLMKTEEFIVVELVMGKAGVAPSKTVTIPRLEVTTSIVLVKVANMLKEELDHDGLQDFYWTESKVVLGFINNESRRLQVYIIANRVQLIKDHTSPD